MQALLDAIATMNLPTDAQRIFHGRGGLHPGCEHWALDAYPPVWLLTSFQPVSEETLSTVGEALSARWQQLAPGEPLTWVYQCRHEGQADTRLMAGSVPEPHVVQEDGARFRVHVLRGQNHGLFLDMAEGPAGCAPMWRPGWANGADRKCSTSLPTPAPSRWWRFRQVPGKW